MAIIPPGFIDLEKQRILERSLGWASKGTANSQSFRACYSVALLKGMCLSYNGSALPLPKRKTVLGAGFLCIALTLVVMFTSPAAFRSPVALVVMALIGAAAVLLQIQLRQSESSQLRPPVWLNVAGIIFTIGALFPSALHLGTKLVQAMVLGAVGSFAISSALILHGFRKNSPKPE